jgi:hypothetical protein
VADLAPIRDRLAKCIRLFGSAERANARLMTERALASIGASWTDLGDWIETSFSEKEMREFEAFVRKEEQARAPQSNGHLVLPEDAEMADYCYARRGQLEAKHHEFVDNMRIRTRHRAVSLKERGYLASLYIRLGGRG